MNVQVLGLPTIVNPSDDRNSRDNPYPRRTQA